MGGTRLFCLRQMRRHLPNRHRHCGCGEAHGGTVRNPGDCVVVVNGNSLEELNLVININLRKETLHLHFAEQKYYVIYALLENVKKLYIGKSSADSDGYGCT